MINSLNLLTDPSARDLNGYLRGSYYVGVYGWCTPDEFVKDWEYDGPCSYAKFVPFNVTVELYPCKFMVEFHSASPHSITIF